VTGQTKEDGCVFCNRLECDEDKNFILYRGHYWYVVMNRYPYTNGHLLLVLGRHQPALSDCSPEELAEMGHLLAAMEAALLDQMKPHGINCGFNGGASAGAGIPEHFHIHVLPRWYGDTNFLTTIGNTRVMPQALAESFRLLKPALLKILAKKA